MIFGLDVLGWTFSRRVKASGFYASLAPSENWNYGTTRSSVGAAGGVADGVGVGVGAFWSMLCA